VRGQRVSSYLDERGLRILDALETVAHSHNAQMAEVALAWLLTRPGVTAPIASATTVTQLDSLVRAVQLKLLAADIQLLDHASASS
ncbi:MAG: aldo/keto reductase, partial [Herbaspirillum sp.]